MSEKPVVIIEMRQGIIHQVYADITMKVIVIDSVTEAAPFVSMEYLGRMTKKLRDLLNRRVGYYSEAQ